MFQCSNVSHRPSALPIDSFSLKRDWQNPSSCRCKTQKKEKLWRSDRDWNFLSLSLRIATCFVFPSCSKKTLSCVERFAQVSSPSPPPIPSTWFCKKIFLYDLCAFFYGSSWAQFLWSCRKQPPPPPCSADRQRRFIYNLQISCLSWHFACRNNNKIFLPPFISRAAKKKIPKTVSTKGMQQ